VNPQLKNVAAVTVRRAAAVRQAGPDHRRHRGLDRQRQEPARRQLLMAPLRGVDGQVYAVAQGNLVVSGFGAEGKDGSRIA
jgi:flagellar P-ring protein precursor FlgI